MKESTRSWVYFYSSGDGKQVKFGYTVNPHARVYGLVSCYPQAKGGKMLGCIEGGKDLEAAMHVRFKAHHAKGEWFYLCKDMQSEINNLNLADTIPKAISGPQRQVVFFIDAKVWDRAKMLAFSRGLRLNRYVEMALISAAKEKAA